MCDINNKPYEKILYRQVNKPWYAKEFEGYYLNNMKAKFGEPGNLYNNNTNNYTSSTTSLNELYKTKPFSYSEMIAIEPLNTKTKKKKNNNKFIVIFTLIFLMLVM